MPDNLAPTGSYTVRGSERCVVPQPDLAISSRDITVSGLEGQGSNQVVVAVVHNLGTKDATNVRVIFKVDNSPLGASVLLGRVAAGSSARASVIWDTSGLSGQHTIAATADPNNAIPESNETNNTGLRTVTVSGGTVT
jgi:subtilase family serine protease